MRTAIAVALFVWALTGTSAAGGQPAATSTLGEIRGVVVDVTGVVLPGATVSLNGPESRRGVTNEKGEFAFQLLLPGSYELQVDLAGFTTASRRVAVRAGARAPVTIALAVGSLAETLTVTAESPRVQTSRARARVPAPAPPAVGVAGGLAGGVVGGLTGNTFDLRAVPESPRAGETYAHVDDNTFRETTREPLSTFAIDVDTASYANVRRFLREGQLPPPDAVRIEELVNYFRFDYPPPTTGAPFAITTDLAACPWNEGHRLALVGLRGRTSPVRETPPRNLVFLVDVSGSMSTPDKLPLVRQALRLFAAELTANDRLAIVVYAGASGLALPSTAGDRHATIDAAIDRLEAGGSTNGGDGIQLAYRVAREHFVKGGVNRVLLATDGDFNVGVTSLEALERLIETERQSGVFLSVLGVGTGNLRDATMEALADRGNGNYAYLDSLREARKVLLEEAGATLVTIAKDVKIQVEFNPAAVAAYRLVGYENRLLRKEDFNDDRKDAGEIGEGHTVTALYEIVPAGGTVPGPSVDPLKYQRPGPAPVVSASADELMTVKVRYKAPDGDDSRLLTVAVPNRVAPMSPTLAFASAVAEFGLVLRGSPHAGGATLKAAAERARRARGDDVHGYRAEFVSLVELADGLRRLARR